MNWASILLTALSLVPATIQTVDTVIVGAKQGVAKKALAMQVLSSATGIADEALTGTDKASADAISGLVSKVIDVIVKKNNANAALAASTATA